MENIIEIKNISFSYNDECLVLEDFSLNIKKGKYDLLLTHKLFPMINKSSDFNFKAKENDNGSFYGIFENKIEERNKKEEITFEMKIVYLYRFLDLN
jgi:hypothetical protein